MLGKPLLIWGKLANPGNGYGLRKRLETEGAGKGKRLSQLAVKGLVKVTWKQMWFDLVAARTPPEQIDWLSNPVLVLFRMGASHASGVGCRPRLSPDAGHSEAVRGDWGPSC